MHRVAAAGELRGERLEHPEVAGVVEDEQDPARGHGALVDEHAALAGPVHPLLEILAPAEALEHEQAAQEILGEQRHVRRVRLEVGREVEQRLRVGVEPSGHVDEAGGGAAELLYRLAHLDHGQVLEHLAADHEVERPLRDMRLGDVADQDPVAHLGRRELARGRAEVDPLDLDPELGQEEHQESGPAADVEHAGGLEDLFDQRRVPVLDAAARLQLVAVALLAPVGGEVLVVVVLRR